MDRSRLIREAQELGFPAGLIRAALAAYAGPRLISLNGSFARPLYPRRGIVAGCSLATTLVKVYYLRAFDDLRRAMHTDISMDIHIDDIILALEGKKSRILSELIEAHENLRGQIEGRMKGKVAEAKTSVSTSSREIAES